MGDPERVIGRLKMVQCVTLGVMLGMAGLGLNTGASVVWRAGVRPAEGWDFGSDWDWGLLVCWFDCSGCHSRLCIGRTWARKVTKWWLMSVLGLWLSVLMCLLILRA